MSWRAAGLVVATLALASGTVHLVWVDQATRWYVRLSKKPIGRLLMIRNPEDRKGTIFIGVVQVGVAASLFIFLLVGRPFLL